MKYATKDEKQTESFSAMMRRIVSAAKANDKSVRACFSDLLINTIGERDYTAQEVCGQLGQLPHVQFSRMVQKMNLGSYRALAQKRPGDGDEPNSGEDSDDDNDDDGTAAAAESNVDRYAKRPTKMDSPALFNYISEFDSKMNPIEDETQRRIPFVVPHALAYRDAEAFRDVDEAVAELERGEEEAKAEAETEREEEVRHEIEVERVMEQNAASWELLEEIAWDARFMGDD